MSSSPRPASRSAEVQGRTVFVIDILRATTSMCAALSHGAKAIIPVASTEEALRLAQTIGSSRRAARRGEELSCRFPAFPLATVPLEMTESVVRGKTLVVTTTNGTKALLACQGAAAVYPAAAVNLTVAAEKAREVLERDKDARDRVRRTGWRVLRSTTPTVPADWSPRRWAAGSPGAGSTTPRWRAWISCGGMARGGSARCFGAAPGASSRGSDSAMT